MSVRISNLRGFASENLDAPLVIVTRGESKTCGEAAGVERTYMIMSVKHTRPGHCWITFWRTNDTGYAFRMDWCGEYPESAIIRQPGYYDSVHGTYAVPAEYVSARAILGHDESGFAHRVPYTKRMWRKMIRAAARARATRDRAHLSLPRQETAP